MQAIEWFSVDVFLFCMPNPVVVFWFGMKELKGFLGIDVGTQGLSVLFTDENMRLVATGQGAYKMVAGLGAGCYEQNPADWESALYAAITSLNQQLDRICADRRILAIGISGQMHGEVLMNADGQVLSPARLWCDTRNEDEGRALTSLFGVKIPKRITVARWLWTIRNRPDVARRTARLITPGGWIAFRLTGQCRLGIGDASGMFPIDQAVQGYDPDRLRLFDELTPMGMPKLVDLLPHICLAGEDGGTLQSAVAEGLGLCPGIPVAPAEGDQPAALAGSLIADAGMVSMSFGTSVCANSVGNRAFHGIHPAVDHFCAADGKPINMVWLRNGTTFMNKVVEMFAGAAGDRASAFAHVMPLLLDAPPDCGGLLALPFIDDEPSLNISHGNSALLYGLSASNMTPGNMAKAALLATMFNLKIGVNELTRQSFPRKEIVLSGGLTQTPALGRILADVFATPVVLMKSAHEGSAWGAALLARFRWLKMQGDSTEWGAFLRQYAVEQPMRFMPQSANVEIYESMFKRYSRLLQQMIGRTQ